MNSMFLTTQLFLEAEKKKKNPRKMFLTLFAKVKKTKKELLGNFFWE